MGDLLLRLGKLFTLYLLANKLLLLPINALGIMRQLLTKL